MQTSEQNDGGPAFPHAGFINYDESVTRHERSGISVRDHFAGQALIGLLSDPTLDMNQKQCASWAYGQADAMLAERRRGTE